jgi:hypothetical protein
MRVSRILRARVREVVRVSRVHWAHYGHTVREAMASDTTQAAGRNPYHSCSDGASMLTTTSCPAATNPKSVPTPPVRSAWM